MRTCYIIDDELPAIKTLQSYIEKIPWLETIGYNQNPLDALTFFQDKNIYPDITFLDIDMAQICGIELAAMLQGKTLIVFTTAYPNYALEAFELEISDYLLKPFSYERFVKSVYKLNNILLQRASKTKEAAEDYFYIQTDGKGKLVKLYFRDILYIESQKNYLSIVTTEKKNQTYLTLSEIEEKLPSAFFLRIHKSYIINIEKISHVEGNDVFLADIKEGFPIGASYRELFSAHMQGHLIKTKRSR